jgi:hypothetical protein
MFLLINIFQGNQAMPFLSMKGQLLFRFIMPADWNAAAAQAQSGFTFHNSPIATTKKPLKMELIH